MKTLIILLALVSTAVQAAPGNIFRTPTCVENVLDLPIYNFTAKANKSTDDELTLYSTVTLIGKNLWRTTAHSVGYNRDGYYRIIMPHRSVTAKVTLLDIQNDVAYLSAPSDGLVPIPPMTKALAEHEPVWNIGFPGIFDRRMVSYEGMFARYENDGRITVSAMGWGGMSGGATLRCNGKHVEMIGTITATKRSLLSAKFWTDEKGVVNSEKIYVNSGFTLIAPIK